MVARTTENLLSYRTDPELRASGKSHRREGIVRGQWMQNRFYSWGWVVLGSETGAPTNALATSRP